MHTYTRDELRRVDNFINGLVTKPFVPAVVRNIHAKIRAYLISVPPVTAPPAQ